MKATPRSVEEYLAGLSPQRRAALERLRATIAAAAPDAEECIAYNMPAFRLNGQFLVGYSATTKGCSFYAGAHPIREHADDLSRYETSKGTIRFSHDGPLSLALIRKLVKTRISEARDRAR